MDRVIGFKCALTLLGIGWLFLGFGLAGEARRTGPELALRTYLTDLEGKRLEAALAALTPEAAARWQPFVEFQQHNRYEVVSVAVRSPSLIESARQGQPWQPTQATLVVDVVDPAGVRWRGSTIVPFQLDQGRWLLARPPFASDQAGRGTG